MQRIISLTDSVFARTAASSADDFYDELYANDDHPASSDGEWEDFPADSHIYDDIGVSGHYNVTHEEHKMLHDWRGPNGEQIEYHPERSDGDNSSDVVYRSDYEMPDGTIKNHTFHPPSSYDHEDVDLGRSRWTHGYNWYDPSKNKVIESYWHGEAPEYGNNGDLTTMLEKAHRLNSGEPLRSVYPLRKGLYDED